MKVLFAAEKHAWGGILNTFRQALMHTPCVLTETTA
jgi:hypothetical protein